MKLKTHVRPGTFVVVLLFIAGAAVVLPAPDVRADVDIVPVVEVMNNTVVVDLLIDGDIAHANVTREYTLNESKGIDEIFNTGIVALGSRETAARLEAPEWGSLNQAGDSFNISFNTSFESNSRVLVKYNYSFEFQGIGALNFSRIIISQDEVHAMWTWMMVVMSDLNFKLHSNMPVTAGDGAQEKTGTDLEFNYSWNISIPGEFYRPDVYQNHHLVSWSGNLPTAYINETIYSNLTPERHAMMDDLINSEFVNITIGPSGIGLSYFMHGEFNLNYSILYQFGPVWLWFPNNVTSAEAWISSEPCEVQESVRDGQRGFYILANNNYNMHPQLVVNITGRITDPWCDFFIVTVPMRNSSIKYILPGAARITGYGSPYEIADFENTTSACVLDFHGICLGRGPVHVEWNTVIAYPCQLNLSLTNVTRETAKLAWKTTSNSDFVHYEVYRSDCRGGPGVICAVLKGQGAREYTVGGLDSNTTYYFTVRKVMASNGSVDSEQMEVRTLPEPPVPCKVSALRLGENSTFATVTWTPSTSSDFSYYEVFCSSEKGQRGMYVASIRDRSTVVYNMTGLDLNTSYFFTILTNTERNGYSYSDQTELTLPKVVNTKSEKPGPASSSPYFGLWVLMLTALVVIAIYALRRVK